MFFASYDHRARVLFRWGGPRSLKLPLLVEIIHSLSLSFFLCFRISRRDIEDGHHLSRGSAFHSLWRAIVVSSMLSANSGTIGVVLYSRRNTNMGMFASRVTRFIFVLWDFGAWVLDALGALTCSCFVVSSSTNERMSRWCFGAFGRDVVRRTRVTDACVLFVRWKESWDMRISWFVTGRLKSNIYHLR